MKKEHGIYKYVYDGKVIYIGKTDSSFRSRINGHAKEKKFNDYSSAEIFVFRTANNTETTIYEKLLINKYCPVLNVQDKHKETTNIIFEEPEWISYEDYEILLKEERKKEKKKPLKKKEIEHLKMLRIMLYDCEYDLLHWNRELWVIEKLKEMIKLKQTEYTVEMPTEFIIKNISNEEQFTNATKNSILYGLKWIIGSYLKDYDICSFNQRNYVFFSVKYAGLQKYTFYRAFENDENLFPFYQRMLLGYGLYIKNVRDKAFEKKQILEETILEYKSFYE